MPTIAGIEITDGALAAAMTRMEGRFRPAAVSTALMGQGVLVWHAEKIASALIEEESQAGRIQFTNAAGEGEDPDWAWGPVE